MGIVSSLFGLVSGRISNTPKPKYLGDWTLVPSPTPSDRFVMEQIPFIDLSETDSLKFANQDGPDVKLSGKIIEPPVKSSYDEDIEYQRLYVKGDDGGILALDFPVFLDLEEDLSSRLTILIIPGTVEGSRERKIRSFVCDCLMRNIFPIVMNPRGCAGARVTTPRLFTAGDSNDVSVVVQYISMKRPCTTLIAVAWDYGANMLTKYLAESGNETPIVAATCIDNPFDLEEATKYKVYDEQTNGFIGILQANKGIFYGPGKRFDVSSALSASSILDFERAISMVSYGYDNIEDFYVKSGTRTVIDKVKVHVLFIQNDDVFYIPRSLIADNPYTSLLLYSFNPSRKIDDDRLTLSWCQRLILEWLMAAEEKGRLPLCLRPPLHSETPQSSPPPGGPSVERGQVLQTAQVVMSMLDVTMPEALSDAQKKKVLTAVGQGETLIKALQDVVPEDVRGQLTTAVSSILQSPGSDLKFDTILKLGHKEAPENNSKDLYKERLENAKCKQEVHSLDQKKSSGPEGGIHRTEDVEPLDEKEKGEESVNASEMPEKPEKGKESVASPVKEDSEVDREGLAEHGQKGSVVSSVSKKAGEKDVAVEEEGVDEQDVELHVEPPDEKEKGEESVNASEMPEKPKKGKEYVSSPPRQPPPLRSEMPQSPPSPGGASVERGQVLQTAQEAMNVLDVTMPEALSDAQKEKVLTAVGEGETIVKALQDDVPEDVRGMLTTAVSSILQSPGSDLKFDKDKDELANANCEQDVQSLNQKEAGGPEGGYSSVDDHSEMSARDMESDTVETDAAIQGGNTAETDVAIHGGNTVQTDVEIMGGPSKGQDSSSTLDVSDRAGAISNQRKDERSVPEEGRSNLKEEDFSSDQNKKSEPCITGKISSIRENEAENNQDQEENRCNVF